MGVLYDNIEIFLSVLNFQDLVYDYVDVTAKTEPLLKRRCLIEMKTLCWINKAEEPW